MNITNVKKYIKTNYLNDDNIKKCFLSSLIFALFSYLYCFVNNLNNYDNIAVTPVGYGNGIASGRWFLTMLGDTVHAIWGNYNIPFFNGIVAVLILAVCACMVIKIFEIKNSTLCIIIGGITVVFPAIASGMFFTYTVHFYMISILLALIGIMIAKKANIVSILISAFMFAFSLGIYQAYLPFTVTVLLLLVIKMCLDHTYSAKQVLSSGIKFLIAIAFGYVFYRIILTLSLKLYNVSLFGYQGINEMGSLSFSQIASGTVEAYKRFLLMPIRDYMSFTITRVLKVGVLGIYLITFISVVLSYKKIPLNKFLLLMFSLAIFPLATNLITVMVPNGEIYTLMGLGVIGVFYLPIIFIDNINIERQKIYTVLKTTTMIILSICILNYIWLTNGNFRAMYYANSQIESYYATMYTRVKSMAGYATNKEVLFVGKNIEDETYYNRWSNTPFKYGGNRYTFNHYSRKDSVENYLGYMYREILEGSEDYKKYENDILTMNRYPDDGSIKVLDEVILVRFE